VRRATLAIALAVLLAPPPAAARRASRHARGESTRARILLAGEWAEVRWTDGDTFRVLTGPHANRTARLQGINTLETFGPVHRIGTAGGHELLAVAKASAAIAAGASVRCGLVGRDDVYGRLLVECPEVAEALVRSGHGMVFAVDADPDRRLVQLQRDAQAARVGIWVGGAPPLLPTSVHSADEPDLGPKGAYDRIADTRTGVTEARPHARVYRTCEEVCVGDGPERACLIYVPFARRYKGRPACLADAGAEAGTAARRRR
jgi:endonuclease YncB( thermonuclease family)